MLHMGLPRLVAVASLLHSEFESLGVAPEMGSVQGDVTAFSFRLEDRLAVLSRVVSLATSLLNVSCLRVLFANALGFTRMGALYFKPANPSRPVVGAVRCFRVPAQLYKCDLGGGAVLMMGSPEALLSTW